MEKKNEGPLKRIWKLAASQHRKLKESVFLAAIGVAAGLVPYFCAAKIIIILLSGTGDMKQCVPLLVIALAGNILKVLLMAYSTAISHKATFAVLAELRIRCIHKLSKLSMGTLESESIGRWKSIIVDQIDGMETTLAHLIPEMTSNALVPIALIIIVFFIDWRLALVSMATLPIGMFVMMGTMKDYPKMYEQSVQIGKTMNDAIVEYIGGIQVIKAFNQGENSYKGYAEAVNSNADFYYKWMKSSQFGMACYRNICPAVLVGVLPVGLIFFMNGSISTADFITVMILSMSIVGPIIAATNFIDSLAQTGTIIESVETILNAKEQMHPAKKVELAGTDICLEKVSFAYDGSNKKVLNDINLKIPAGSMTAFVGPSGSGKSTITKLIAAFWDVEEGSIYLGGKNLKEIPLSQIASQIAYVSQDNFLFDESIRENIRMGKETASDEEVEAVAKAAGCHEFISHLEYGYDTVVGGGGAHLSGGERQRIAIARAMLKDAPIVILDEATAYIDPENEAILQKAISQLVKGKTLIMIAHRLSTIINADQIIVVDQGKISAIGKHEKLLKSSQLYHEMWEAHMGTKEGDVTC